MRGHIGPITCCDRDCAFVNGCREGGYQCCKCGKWFCAGELNEDEICDDCLADAGSDEDDDELGICASCSKFMTDECVASDDEFAIIPAVCTAYEPKT